MSIDYELAKELKDAAFPQEKCSSLIYQGKSEAIGCPTLEEPIEAINWAETFVISRNHPRTHQKEWTAFVYGHVSGEYFSTPTEAVAMLYLELYKRNRTDTPRVEGNELGYAAAHSWLREYHTDKKKACEECSSSERLQFAKRHGRPYSRDIADYRILCQSCHLKYDGQFNKPPWNKGHQPPPKLCEHCSTPFVPAKPRRRFCSNSCASIWKAANGMTNKSHDARTGRWLALNKKV